MEGKITDMSFDGDLYPEAGAAKVITSKGDLVRGNASGDRERYGIGSTGQVLTVASGTVAWQTSSGGGASTANVQNQGNFTTTSTSPVDVTNYSLTLPTTTAQSDDCICVFSGVMTNSVSDAFNFELVKNTTAIASSTCEPTTPFGHNSVVVANTICDADGDTLKLTLHSAGGNSCTFKSGGETTSGMTVFAV